MSKFATFKRIFGYAKKYRVFLALTIVFSAFSVILNLFSTILIGKAVDCVAGVNNVNWINLVKIIYIFICVTIATVICEWLVSFYSGYLAYKTARDLRNQVIRKLQVIPLSTLDTQKHGEIMDRVVQDIDLVSNGLLLGFTQLFAGIATIIATLIIMFYLNYIIALVVVLITPLSLIVSSMIAKKSYKYFNKLSTARGENTAFVEEYLSNYKTVVTSNYTDTAICKYEKSNNSLQKLGIKATFISSLINPCTRIVNSLVYAVVGIVGSMLVINKNFVTLSFSIGILTSFLLYANKYTKPFNEISSVFSEFQNSLNSAVRVFEILDMDTQRQDSDNAIILLDTRGNINAEGITFSYDTKSPIINDISFSVAQGQKVAIVGESGCGKTTLINLIMRFYELDGGALFIDNAEITTIKRQSYQNKFGMVLQDTWLKKASIFENIKYGKPNCTIEDVKSVAKKVYADNFISCLPLGYDTIVSDDCTNISVGQKQLLCIARVMLISPPILILDEATSAIDSRTEILVQKAFDKLICGRTSFIVAHRLSTIKEADVIFVMQNGKIVEKGKHNDLLAKKGYYYTLYNSQFDA